MPLELTHEDFLTPEQVRLVKSYCRERATRPVSDGRRNPVRDWAIMHIALDAGLRVSEICALKVGDVLIERNNASVIVQHGKGDKRRGVRMGEDLRSHLAEYLAWKEELGEPTSPNDPLFISSRSNRPLTRTAVYRIFKAIGRATGLPSRFSIHSCRHTYASLLYRASDYNIRLVQKQLGHRSIQTTQIYADVLSEDAVAAVNKLPQ